MVRVSKDGMIVKIKIKGWLDMKGKLIKIKDFYSPQLKNTRNILIYLPPGYDEDKRYPVLYMHDGQNLFDKNTSFSKIEWKVDETLNELITTGKIKSIIVVGIYNNSDRLSEYSPWYNERYKAGEKGEKYIEFIINTLKPHIDDKFSTNKEENYIGGFSMGGLILLYALKYPFFKGAIVMSPSLFLEIQKYLKKLKM